MMDVKLRRPATGDAEARAAFGYHPEVMRGFGVALDAPKPMTSQEAQAWVARIEENPHASVILHGGALVGQINLFHVNPVDSWANLAIAIVDPVKLGQGIGREAIRRQLATAFGDLKLHRVAVRVLASNTRAIRCYEKCGFVLEGRERESARLGERWEDDVIMGVLAKEFDASGG